MRAALIASIVATIFLSGAAVGLSRPIPARSIVGCDLWIGTAERPYRESGIILDRIGLPRGRYPWRVVRSGDPVFPFWAKWGILLRAGTAER